MRRLARVLRTAAWLGWQVEANWADPVLFLAYAIAKPLATTLILFFMVKVVSQGHATGETFQFIFIGNTFFLYVTEVLIGISWTVFRDREDYETLKYIYVAPVRLLPYLMGRAFTRVATASVGVLAALLFGRVVLGLSIGSPGTNWLLLSAAVLLGLVGVLWLGIILAGISLVVARHSMNLNEGLSGLFFLLCGAVFPLDVLPRWALAISLALPFTYWLELLRRMLTGRGFARSLAMLSDGDLWRIIAGATLGLCVAAILWFGWCERYARDRGLIDWKTNY
ncbi:MAG: ABC transporter permease [Candidatus Eisenbacteria bacterium]|uniref:ABC transporter permease n=1 Tax=Eiseniibacteriota bacterium TaxID=2212470 RepID=A0A538T106_UNCEI|nr:MAG: ABC transporter permease [Candidatus Eisenbacteria bacterium]